MADSLIRWKRSDYAKLSYEVRRFNKRIKELEVDEINYLPDLKDYKEIKQNILSRKELNRILNSLRRFSKEGMNAKVELPSGQELTKWEYREIKLARNRAIRGLQAEKSMIEQGSKWLGMGDERLDQIESTIKSLNQLEMSRGSEFRSKVIRILDKGRTDRGLKQAMQFRENFMKAFNEMSTFDNYELLKSKLDSIKNPIKFFEYVSQTEILLDLFLYYNDKATSQTYGGFASNQDAFNYVLESLGLLS